MLHEKEIRKSQMCSILISSVDNGHVGRRLPPGQSPRNTIPQYGQTSTGRG